MTALGTPLADWLARGQVRGRAVIETVLDLPIVLPPAVAGIALLMTFGRRGVFGPLLAQWGINLPFTTLAVIMAQVFVAAPFFIRSAQTGFVGVPREIEEVASDLGADGWRVFRRVTFPLAGPALLSGVVLSGARALGEFGATILFAGNFSSRTQTMPLAIYQTMERNLGAGTRFSRRCEPVLKATTAGGGQAKALARRQLRLLLQHARNVPLRFQPVENVVCLAQADVPDLPQLGCDALMQIATVRGLLIQETQQNIFG
jgi:molybdate ABC transporter permease protein